MISPLKVYNHTINVGDMLMLQIALFQTMNKQPTLEIIIINIAIKLTCKVAAKNNASSYMYVCSDYGKPLIYSICFKLQKPCLILFLLARFSILTRYIYLEPMVEQSPK